MFRAILCSSSGGHTVYMQHTVSSLSMSGRGVRAVRHCYLSLYSPCIRISKQFRNEGENWTQLGATVRNLVARRLGFRDLCILLYIGWCKSHFTWPVVTHRQSSAFCANLYKIRVRFEDFTVVTMSKSLRGCRYQPIYTRITATVFSRRIKYEC
jgi:hypothetical protein